MQQLMIPPFLARSMVAYLAILFLLQVSGAFLCTDAVGREGDRRILLLSSYHPGDVWSDGIVDGFVSGIGEEDRAGLFIEYLDSRRHGTKEADEIFHAHLRRKYRDVPFSLIVCADDPALDFVLHHRRELFPDVPVVFCGINNFRPERLGGEGGITGVSEFPDINSTIKLMFSLQPKLRKLVVVASKRNSTHLANLEHFNQVKPVFRNTLQIVEHVDITATQVTKAIASLSSDTAVLALSNLLDFEGRELSLAESARILATTASVPVYCLWDFQLETGTIGGVVVSAGKQGRAAAEMAVGILAGEGADSVPVRASPNQLTIDWQAVERFRLDPARIPDGAEILGRPQTLWRAYRGLILVTLLFISFQSLLIVLLLDSRKRRQRVNQKLRESEGRLRIIFEHAPLGMSFHDTDGRIVDCNRNFATFLDIPRQQLIGSPLPGGFPSEVRHAIDRARQGQSLSIEIESMPPESVPARYLRFLFNPATDDSPPFKVVTICEDWTERAMAEERRRHLERQLQQSQKLEAVGTLAGGIAHDFNNLLSGILGFAELARDDVPADSPAAQEIDQVIGAAIRARNLVRQILAFSRHSETKKEALLPGTVILDVLRLQRPVMPPGIELVEEIDPEAGPVLVDPVQLQDIVARLLANAIQAMAEKGGMLTVGLARVEVAEGEIDAAPGDYIRLSVGDTGCGIAPEVRKRIFDPYFTTRELGKGSGMGLAVVHGIVKEAGGFLNCTSSVGEGTVFNVFLPAFVSRP